MQRKEQRLQKLRNAVSDIELSEEEKRTLEWLSGWEDSTVNNIVSIIEKVSKS